MQPHLEIKALQQKYKSNPVATEALRAGLSISSDYVTSLVSSLKVSAQREEEHRRQSRKNTLSSIQEIVGKIKVCITYLSSTKEGTQEEREDDLKYCFGRLDYLQGIINGLA